MLRNGTCDRCDDEGKGREKRFQAQISSRFRADFEQISSRFPTDFDQFVNLIAELFTSAETFARLHAHADQK